MKNAGIRICPMSTCTENPLVVRKIVTESARQLGCALVWKRSERQPELVREFINFVRDCMEEERRGTQPCRLPPEEFLPPEDTPYL